MRPIDFIGRVVRVESGQVVSHVEGTIFPYQDKLKGTRGWRGSFMKCKNADALLAAHAAGDALLLVCGDGRRGTIILEPDIGDWGTGMLFRGLGELSEPTVPPAWRSLDRTRTEDGTPDAS